jgi:hypothetical protein
VTAARLKPAPPDGSGLDDTLVTEHYEKRAAGTPIDPLYAIVVLRPTGHSEQETSNGPSQIVKYTAIQLEPCTESRLDELKDLLRRQRDARGGASGQMSIDDLDPYDADQKSMCLEALLDHVERNGIDLVKFWFEFHDREFVAEPKKASLVQLRDFCDERGISYQLVTRPEPEAEAEPIGGLVDPDGPAADRCGADVNGYPCDRPSFHDGDHLRILPIPAPFVEADAE